MKNRDIIKIFNQWKNDPRLHNDILASGCMERTRIICEDLVKQGFLCGFIYLPKEEKGDETISCVALLKNGQDHCFRWMRHVVPVVLDEHDNLIVLDVCLMNGPEKFEQWANHIYLEDRPLTKKDVFINHSNFLNVLEFRSKNKDPWQALDSFYHTFKDFAIQQNQVPSKWLKEVQNPVLFLKKAKESFKN